MSASKWQNISFNMKINDLATTCIIYFLSWVIKNICQKQQNAPIAKPNNKLQPISATSHPIPTTELMGCYSIVSHTINAHPFWPVLKTLGIHFTSDTMNKLHRTVERK